MCSYYHLLDKFYLKTELEAEVLRQKNAERSRSSQSK